MLLGYNKLAQANQWLGGSKSHFHLQIYNVVRKESVPFAFQHFYKEQKRTWGQTYF